MKLRSPIQTHFMNRGHVAILTQLFGENKNSLFYGSLGHSGIDFRTQHANKWQRVGDWTEGKVGEVKRSDATKLERAGYIPCVASHDGQLTTNIFQYDRSRGWYVKVTTDEMEEDGKKVQYQTLYYHLEAYWRSLGTFKMGKNSLFNSETVRAGAVIGICGNTGKYTTGAHLHFELRKREKVNGKWTNYVPIDPMPHFYQEDIVMQRYDMTSSDWYYTGKKVLKNPLKSPKEVI